VNAAVPGHLLPCRPVLRYLPAGTPGWEEDADVVVVGSGAAGISAALAASAHGRRVLLLSKGDSIGGGATPLAQGGLAAAIGPGDGAALHRSDTVAAGAGLCEPGAVAALAEAAPGEIARLAGLGARLETARLGLEGGHSRRRIVHAGGDASGAEVHRVLARALRASPVRVLTGTLALDLLLDGRGQAGGLIAGMAGDGGSPLRIGVVSARAVVIATGGFGHAYATTTAPAGMTGDGLALAARAGAELADLEFVQFHPTVLWQRDGSGQQPLITEALRGAGAVLVDGAGRPVMAGRHPLADLAPRDVVAAVMYERIAQDGGPGHLWLDATGLGRTVLEHSFPTVTAACRARGIDPATEPIPVAPGAHYACGGIRASMTGQTSVPGLYAVGEVAATGVHGANRLASNSLTESLLAGRLAGEHLGRELPPRAGALAPPPAGPGVHPAARTTLTAAMSRHAGVIRDRAGLETLLAVLATVPGGIVPGGIVPGGIVPGGIVPEGHVREGSVPGVAVPPGAVPPGAVPPGAVPPGAVPPGAVAAGSGAAGESGTRAGGRDPDLATVEATSLHTVSVLVAAAALARAESRGCHRRSDAPAAFPGPARHTLLRWRDGELTSVSSAERGMGARLTAPAFPVAAG
jgi:L-aspartate oxidase